MGQPPYQNQPQQGYQAPPQPYGPAPAQQAYSPYTPKPVQPWVSRSRIAASLLLASALLAIIGSFLPWGTFGEDEFANIESSFNGFDGPDGWLAVGTAVVLMILGILSFVRAARKGVTPIAVIVIVLGILSGLWLAFIGAVNMSAPETEFGSLEGFGLDFTPGIGLWILILAGLLALAGVGWMIASHMAAPKGPAAGGPGGSPAGPPPGYQPAYQPPQPQPPPAGGYPPQPGHAPPPEQGYPPPGQSPPPGGGQAPPP